MKFIDDDVAQCVRLIVSPKFLGIGLHQQIVEHFVVGQQDVGGRLADDAFVGNDFGGAHPGGGGFVLVADVESGGDAIEGRGAVNQVGDAFCLIGCQGIHWVNQDGFDA